MFSLFFLENGENFRSESKKIIFSKFFRLFRSFMNQETNFHHFLTNLWWFIWKANIKKTEKTSNFKNKSPLWAGNKSWNFDVGNFYRCQMDVWDVQIYGNYFFSNLKSFLGTKQHLNKLLVIFLTFWWNATKRRITRNRKKVTFFHFFRLFLVFPVISAFYITRSFHEFVLKIMDNLFKYCFWG